VEIISIDPPLALNVDHPSPLDALETDERIDPSDPTANLVLDDPSEDRISPFADIGEMLTSY